MNMSFALGISYHIYHTMYELPEKNIPMSEGKGIAFRELPIYTMRHLQEHSAQLSMFLGQHGVARASDWIGLIKVDEWGLIKNVPQDWGNYGCSGPCFC